MRILLLFLLLAAPAKAQILSESFDAVTPPAIPTDWSSTAWVTSASSPSTGSGINNLVHTGTAASSFETTAIDLTGAGSSTLTYLARRTSSYDQTALSVTAAISAGTSIPVIASGAALPAASSTWATITATLPATLLGQSDVRLTFNSTGGNSSGANVRIDDLVLTVTAGEGPPATGGTFGFGSAPDTVLATTTGFPLPLDLVLTDTTGLQGLQFRASWSDPSITYTGITRGAAIADLGVWMLSDEPVPGYVDILLLATGNGSLSAGDHSALLSLVFDADSVASASAVSLSITRLIGSLAVAAGSDAGLGASPSSKTITVVPRQPTIRITPDSLDLGSTAVGATSSAPLRIHNEGTADLSVTAISSTSALYTAAPEVQTITPGDSSDVTITFTPVISAFGVQLAVLTVAHNAPGGAAEIPVTAVGISGRGDVDADAIVDVMDVVLGIDMALGRLSASTAAEASLDLYPFPTGDGSLDVRDLTVLSRAIVRGRWPDETLLPAPPPDPAGKVSGRTIVLRAESDGTQTNLWLESDVPLRGFQAELIAPDGTTAAPKNATWIEAQAGRVRILLAPVDGEPIAAGLHDLGSLQSTGSIKADYLTAIDQDMQRVAVYFERTWPEGDLPLDFEIGRPYPNPWYRDRPLRIPVHAAKEGRLGAFDVLGREVISWQIGPALAEIQWTDPNVVPGLYLLRESRGRAAQSVVIQ